MPDNWIRDKVFQGRKVKAYFYTTTVYSTPSPDIGKLMLSNVNKLSGSLNINYVNLLLFILIKQSYALMLISTKIYNT